MTATCMGGSTVVIALLVGYIQHLGGWHDRTPVQIAVLALIVFDLIFGMFIISTTSAKRWYTRPGPEARRLRMLFVLGHLPYLVAGAALVQSGQRSMPRF